MTGAVKQHRVEHEERASGRLQRPLDLLCQVVRWEVFDPMRPRQHYRGAILPGEGIDTEESANRKRPRRDEVLIGQIAMARRLMMYPPG